MDSSLQGALASDIPSFLPNMLFEKLQIQILQILSGTRSHYLPRVLRINRISVVHQMHFFISNFWDVNPKSVGFSYPALMEAFFNKPLPPQKKNKHLLNVTKTTWCHLAKSTNERHRRCLLCWRFDRIWASPLWWRMWPASIDIEGEKNTSSP